VDADFVKRFEPRGLTVAPSAAREVDDGIARDAERLGKVIREAGIKLD
jgi:tripartite-type tricarboxylate transporter receptor subunit TctC